MKRTIREIKDNEALEYAIYTVEDRAIPSMIDGLKPVQRTVLYSIIKNAKNEFKKVASVCGRVSEYGYHHGEGSAQSACQLMAAEWYNNVILVAPNGSFGSRLVKTPAAARYTNCKLHANFNKIFMDSDFAPIHEDPEHIPPKFYLPLIPFVLINGINGIATGYRTDIMPHCIESVKEKVIEYIKTGDIKAEPLVKFPDFRGNVEYVGVSEKNDLIYCQKGVYEIKKNLIIITEIPTKFDREKYVNHLNDLIDKKIISDYEDRCSKEFNFVIKTNGSFKDFSDENIRKVFKLDDTLTQHINVLSEKGKLKQYDTTKELIKNFVVYRKQFIVKRIEKDIEILKFKIEYAEAKCKFIQLIKSGKVELKNITRKQLAFEIIKTLKINEKYVDDLLNLNIYSFTDEKLKELLSEIEQNQKTLISTTEKLNKIDFVYLEDLTKI